MEGMDFCVVLVTFVSSEINFQFCFIDRIWFDRVEEILVFPLLANTIITYCSIVFLGSVFCLSSFGSCCCITDYDMAGIPCICWGTSSFVKILLCAAFQTMLELRKLYICLLRTPCMCPPSPTYILDVDCKGTCCSSVHAPDTFRLQSNAKGYVVEIV